MKNTYQNSTRIETLLKIFNDRRTESMRIRVGLMQDFIAKYSRLKSKLDAQRKEKFNLIEIFNIVTDEVRHSSFLAWLLDAGAGHQQNDLFFNAFLKLCNIDIDLGHLIGYKVRTEFPEVESIIDILIYRKSSFLIYIENKVYSEEGQDQCAREARDMHRLGARLNVPENRRYAVFLTPDGREPCTGDNELWRSISYRQLGTIFKELMPKISSEKVRYALEDWLEVIMNF